MVPDTEGSSGKIVRAFRTVRKRGPVNLWFRILGEIAYRRVAVLECRLDGELAEVAARVPVRITLLTQADLEAIMAASADVSATAGRLLEGCRS